MSPYNLFCSSLRRSNMEMWGSKYEISWQYLDVHCAHEVTMMHGMVVAQCDSGEEIPVLYD